jgi:hypothetical protein
MLWNKIRIHLLVNFFGYFEWAWMASCLQRSDLVSELVIHVSRSSPWEEECVPIILRQRDSFLQA